jgi:uncharacterized protein
MNSISSEEQQIINKAKEYIKEIFKDDSSGHDIEHSLRVYKNAMEITNNIEKTNSETKLNKFIILLAAILHDVDDYKIKNYDKENPYKNLLNFIEKNNVKIDIDLIKEIISDVSFKAGETKKPKTIEGQIVQDADRLDAIGAIGIARAFAFGGSRNRKIYDNNIEDLYKRNFETFNMDNVSFEQYKNDKKDTVTHFYEKLLKLENMMNTDQAKIIAHKRTEFMKTYLSELFTEIINK